MVEICIPNSKKMGRFSDAKTATYIRAIVGALIHCHANDIIHRDLKLENFVISNNNELKLADFGWSVYTPDGIPNTVCGTLDYLSPEEITGERYDYNIDIWALGVVMYELLCGVTPFYAKGITATYRKIILAKLEFPSHVGKNARDLVSKLIVKDSNKRISLKQVLEHPFMMTNV